MGPNDPGTHPDRVIDAAKVRAKAALKEKHPKLTTLERAFYNIYKEQL
jgi:hypothetical protein